MALPVASLSMSDVLAHASLGSGSSSRYRCASPHLSSVATTVLNGAWAEDSQNALLEALYLVHDRRI